MSRSTGAAAPRTNDEEAAHPDPSTPLREELVRLRARLVYQLGRLAHRHGDELAGFSGLVIRDEEILVLLDELDALDGAGPGLQAPPPASLARHSATEGDAPASPLERMASAYGLCEFEKLVLVLAAAVEIEGRYARLVAYLNDNATRTRPTVSLALQLFRPLDAANPHALACFREEAPLLRYRLLELQGDGPLSDRSLAAPPEVWSRLLGMPETRATEPTRTPLRLRDLVLATPLRAQAAAFVDACRDAGTARALLLCGPGGSGREAVAAAIAAELGHPIFFGDIENLSDPPALRRLVRDALWHGAALGIRYGAQAAAPPEGELGLLQNHPAPVFWIGEAPAPAFLMSTIGPASARLELSRPSAAERIQIWQRQLPSDGSASHLRLAAVAERYRLGPGKIVAAARLSQAARPDGGGLWPEQLERACRDLCTSDFGLLAQPLDCPFSRDDLVLADRVQRELDHILAWERHHAALFGTWGYANKLPNTAGLACLMSGPPGTGKTMSAQVIARELGLPLYRIDLSQVVNKYIGETEKNLARVFDAAREAHAILFFDEADALFGKRTKTRDAHDRYANIETGFLLQRVENHEGITILATNLASNLDDAFMRRFQVVAEFSMPSPEERHRIWQRLLPAREHRDDDLDIVALAERFELSGGEIKNAALAGALFAASDGGRMAMRHAVSAAQRELKKTGRVL